MAKDKKEKKAKKEKDKSGFKTGLPIFDSLSLKHQEFVQALIDCKGNQYKAYMTVYPNVSNATARTNAWRLLANADIKAALRERHKAYWEEKDEVISKSETYRMINYVGRATIADVVDLGNGSLEVKDFKDIPPEALEAIQSIEKIVTETKFGTNERLIVKMHSKIAALELRAKMLGILDPTTEDKPKEIVIKKAIRPDRPQEKKEEGKG